MKKIVIVAEELTPEQQDAVTQHLRSKTWSFWHWYKNLWMISGVYDTLTPRRIHEQMMAETHVGLEDCNILVMEVKEPIAFWGTAPENSWAWMRKSWGKPD